MSSPVVFVTGATGLVGNNVVRQLLENGFRVRALVRDSSDPRPLQDLAIETIYGDIRNPDSVSRGCDRADYVIHSAANVQIGSSGLERHREINVGGTRHVAAASRKAGVRMIHVSTCDAVGLRSLGEPADEDTPLTAASNCCYVITKQEAEAVVREEVALGLDGVIVNPSFMLGPWDWKPSSGRMLLQVAKGRGFLAPQGHSSFSDVRDVAAGILAAMEKGQAGRRYILAGVTMSYLEAWRLIADVTGARRPLRCASDVTLATAGWAGDCWTRLTGREPDVNSAAIALAKTPKNYSSARANAELGYSTRPIEETVRDTWRWFQQHHFA